MLDGDVSGQNPEYLQGDLTAGRSLRAERRDHDVTDQEDLDQRDRAKEGRDGEMPRPRSNSYGGSS